MSTHPRGALFDSAEQTTTPLPVCDHYCGVEARMRKSLALQAELGPVFDITLDCEDGAPIGAEAEHVRMCAELAISAAICACSASPPTGAPSSQSSVTSNTGPISACSARLLRMRASTPQ